MDKVASETNKALKVGKRSYIVAISILASIMILVGILTYVVTPGTFVYDSDGNVISNDWTQVAPEDTDRLPFYRWITAPFEALLFAKGNSNIIMVCVMLILLGGSFLVIDETGGMKAMVQQLVKMFAKRKYILIWAISAFMMLMSSIFGMQEQFLIMYPIIMGLCMAMNWDNFIALSLILLTSGVGFAVAIANPFTVGIASEILGVTWLDGAWFRAIMLVIFFVVTTLIILFMAKKTEKKRLALGLKSETIDELNADSNTTKTANMYLLLFVIVFAIMIIVALIPAISSLTSLFMGVSFLVGTLTIGSIINKSFVPTIKAFGRGILMLLPSVLLVLMAFSVKYIAESAMIMDTLIDGMFKMLAGTNPIITLLLLYLFILVLEFFIPSGSSKAVILVPIFKALPLATISPQLMVLTFLFADGFTNVFFPTCATLLVGLSLANISYAKWFKKTWWFQLAMMAVSLLVILLAYAIGY